MNAQELLLALEALKASGQDLARLKVRVPVHQPGAIGPLPSVGVDKVVPGIDWDSGSLFLSTKEHLSKLSEQQVKAITDSARKGTSWHAYQAHKRFRETEQGLRAALGEVQGCFEAAFIEGLADALAQTQDDRLRDLVERRLLPAMEACVAQTQPPDGQAAPGPVEHEQRPRA